MQINAQDTHRRTKISAYEVTYTNIPLQNLLKFIISFDTCTHLSTFERLIFIFISFRDPRNYIIIPSKLAV